jgi:nucleoside-diphosphate-sugar epimerase
VVAALRAAAWSSWTGVANIGGGTRTSMNEVVRIVSGLLGAVDVIHRPPQRGDVRHTAADCTLARRRIGYQPTVGLGEGLALMVEAERTARSVGVG